MRRDPQDGTARPARVTFVVSGLVVGGAERILTALANGWAEAGRTVAIVTLDGAETPPFFPVDPRIRLQRLGLTSEKGGPIRGVAGNLRRISGVRRAVARTHPDVVISFLDRTNVLTLLASIGARWPVIVSDRSAAGPVGRVWRILRLTVYHRARFLVVQTQRSVEALPASLRRRAVAIPNPVLVQADAGPGTAGTASRPSAPAGAPPGSGEPGLVLALGRLVPEKGFDLLVEAFGSVVREESGARLEIWGAGPEEAALRALVETRGLGGHVTLAGETRHPARVLRRASVFVLSSRIEGFPNVLLEAMATGRPVVAMDCRYGPAEIVRDGVDGVLVPAGDVAALSAAIVRLLRDAALREAMGVRAAEVADRFGFEAIEARWSALVDAARGMARP